MFACAMHHSRNLIDLLKAPFQDFVVIFLAINFTGLVFVMMLLLMAPSAAVVFTTAGNESSSAGAQPPDQFIDHLIWVHR